MAENDEGRTLGDLSAAELIDLALDSLSKLMHDETMSALGTPYAYLSLARNLIAPRRN